MKKLIITGVIVASLAAFGFSAVAINGRIERTKKSPFGFTREQQEVLNEKIKVDLGEMLEDETITNEQYENALKALEQKGFGSMENKMPPLTEEQKAEMTQKLKEELSQKLESGEITQEEYDEKIAEIESGDFRGFIRGGHGRAHAGGKGPGGGFGGRGGVGEKVQKKTE